MATKKQLASLAKARKALKQKRQAGTDIFNRHYPQSNKQQEYIWDWVGGGYNTCFASSKAEATKVAVKMGLAGHKEYGHNILIPTNVRVAVPAEVKRYNSMYSD